MFTVPRVEGSMPHSVGTSALALSGADWRPALAVAAAVLLARSGVGSLEVVIAIVAVARTVWVYTHPGKAGKGKGKADKMASYQADASSETLPPQHRPKPLPSPGEGDPGLDFQAFQCSLEQHCDSALDGLCDQAMVEQGASVLESFGDGALPTRQLDTELPNDGVPEPEDEQDRTYEDLCDSALVDLELDMELLRDVMLEPEHEQDRADDDMCASHLVDIEEPDWRLLGEVESAASQQLLEAQTAAVLREQLDWRLSCASQTAAGSAPEYRIADILQEHARLIQMVRKTFAEYMLWVI